VRLLEVIQRSTAFLESRGIESPRLQVERVLAHLLRIPRLQLYLEFDRPLPEEVLSAARAAIQRRGQRIPLQHILGSESFCGLEFEVGPEVLIPRPETEQLAEIAWTWLEHHAATTGAAPAVLDWGTGSGCLAVTLATRIPAADITAIDISPAALEMARRNARRHGVEPRIRFVLADGVEPLPPGPGFDLVVSNPPYIPSAEIATLQPEVRDHDPRAALDGGPDGLDAYRRLASSLPPRLANPATLLLELGDDQAAAVSGILAGQGWTVIRVAPDLSGRTRFLEARMQPPDNASP
jgi:release factor glutamine methyltransferase